MYAELFTRMIKVLEKRDNCWYSRKNKKLDNKDPLSSERVVRWAGLPIRINNWSRKCPRSGLTVKLIWVEKMIRYCLIEYYKGCACHLLFADGKLYMSRIDGLLILLFVTVWLVSHQNYTHCYLGVYVIPRIIAIHKCVNIRR